MHVVIVLGMGRGGEGGGEKVEREGGESLKIMYD